MILKMFGGRADLLRFGIRQERKELISTAIGLLTAM